jgi:hypothetical protein
MAISDVRTARLQLAFVALGHVGIPADIHRRHQMPAGDVSQFQHCRKSPLPGKAGQCKVSGAHVGSRLARTAPTLTQNMNGA